MRASEPHRPVGPASTTGGGSGPRRRKAGFTLLEVQVAMVILATGLMGLAALQAVQNRQVRHVETWCRSGPTYYLLSQSNRWMRRLEAPAQVESQAGQTAWTPAVAGDQAYNVSVDSLSQQLNDRIIQAVVTLEATGG